MKRQISLIGFLVLYMVSLQAQVVTKIYFNTFYPLENELLGPDGTLEKFGFAAEYYLKENLSLELGGTYNTKTIRLSSYIQDPKYNIDGVFYYDLKKSNTIINLILKKYSGKKHTNYGFFYGGYLRFWGDYDDRVNTNKYPAPYRNFLQGYSLPVSERYYKISLGAIFGYKLRLSNRVTMDLSLGSGFSPSFLYLKKEKYFDSSKNNFRRATPSLTPFHLSFISHITLGYQWGRSSNEE